MDSSISETPNSRETPITESERSSLSRRAFLKAAYAAPFAGSLSYRSQDASNSSIVDESVMTEQRIDISDGDEVSDIVGGISQGDLLVFPEGTFTWDDRRTVTVDDWGIRCHEDTVFEVPPGIGDGERFRVLQTYSEYRTADNVLLENLTFDSSGRAAPGLDIGVRNAAQLSGLEYRMDGPLSIRQQENGLQAFVENETGEFRIDDYRQFNNGDLGGYADGKSRIGMWVGSRHHGTITLQNPVLQGFPNNACYVSRQPGTVIVSSGLLINNNVSAVRVSGNVEVKETTIYLDIDRYSRGPGVIEGSQHNMRGLWADNGEAGTNGGTATGVSFILNSYRKSDGMVDILQNPYMTLEDSQFLLNADGVGVRGDLGQIRVIDCTFDGRSNGAIAAVGDVTGHGNSVSPELSSGDLPVEQRTENSFNWALTHPEVPELRSSGNRTLRPVEIHAITSDVYYAITANDHLSWQETLGKRTRATRSENGTWTVGGMIAAGNHERFLVDDLVDHWISGDCVVLYNYETSRAACSREVELNPPFSISSPITAKYQ